MIDTDTFNEIDDQFAVAHALLSDAVEVTALYAAPFLNERSSSPEDGMEQSYAELHRLLERLDVPAPPVLRGARSFLQEGATPEASEAVLDLIERARARPADQRLTVVAIGAPTNVAAALLLAPDLADRVRIVWLGGHGFDWPVTDEFNMAQDLTASRTLLATRAPLLLIPCFPVASHLLTTRAELAAGLPQTPLTRFLVDRFAETAHDHLAYARPLWDVAASAAVIDPGALRTQVRTCPALRDDLTWDTDRPGREVEVVYAIDRNRVMRDLFGTLARSAPR